MSKIEVNQISSQCGSTLTIGQSGDTVTLAAGATQSGFGRTGTVDWDTTAKTTSFTAVSGNGYFVNTTSGAITVTLPAGSSGSIVSLKDYANTWQTNNVTITPNGTDKINGTNANSVLNTKSQSVTLIYVDATKGWQDIHDSTSNVSGASFIVATGGTVTCCGDYKIHTFTGPGTFTVCSVGNPAGSDTVDYLVVAGGGGGYGYAGGGGAGGYRESSGAASGCYTASPLGACVSALPVTATGYPIVVGGGGASTGPYTPSPGAKGNSGSNSSFSTITSTGGGGGGGYITGPAPNTNPYVVGSPGGSGGGGGNPSEPGSTPGNTPALGGSGNTPPVSPPQGNPGGAGDSDNAQWRSGGGGGGAGATGGDLVPTPSGRGGNGGNGVTSSINGTPTARGGGGGGGSNLTPAPSSGGTGGGGCGGYACTPGTPGTVNTGGGGGGAGGLTTGAGGSGIVIIRYKYQ